MIVFNRKNSYQQDLMTYFEREKLKRVARALSDASAIGELESLVILIAHWHRQYLRVPFDTYAQNWIAADASLSNSILRNHYSIETDRFIYDGDSEFHATPIKVSLPCTSVRSLFSVRLSLTLRYNGIETINDLMKCTAVDLLKLPNLGKKSLAEIEEVLCSLGIKLRRESC